MKSGSRIRVLRFGLTLTLAGLCASASGGMLGCPVTLAWDASPDANVTGYALYYGTENPAVTNRLDVGPVLSVMLTNLYAGSNYFFLVVAYNASGAESVPIGPLYYSPPAITKIRLTRNADGSSRLQFRTAANTPCRVEYSASLNSSRWLTLATTNSDAGGNVAIIDRFAGLVPSRFYRAVRP